MQSLRMPQTRAPSSQSHSNGNGMADPQGNGRDRLPECDLTDYIVNCIHEGRPLTLNDIGRPVFVNHYYAGKPLIPVTSKKLIRLDECDVSTHISARNQQPQGPSHESVEGSLKGPVKSSLYCKHVNVSVEPLEVHKEGEAKYCAVPGYTFLKPGSHRVHII